MTGAKTDNLEALRENGAALVDAYAQFPFTLASGRGVIVRDTEGRKFWDLYGGHAVALLGHAHPAVTAAISTQAEKLLFYSNAAALDIRTQVAERFCAFAGDGLSRVFFCNSGAEANENALKLAIKLTGRHRIASLTGGFHGRTLLALSATDNARLSGPFAQELCPTVRLTPNNPATIDLVDRHTAAVIVEPIQSMAGVVELQAEFLQALRVRCDQVGAMLIYDEVQTGMGRLGRPFAAGESNVSPDIVTSAKGIANGVPMGAVLMSAEVGRQVTLGDMGTTFGGGPLACAALLAVIETIIQGDLMARAADLGEYAKKVLLCGPVVEVRGRGCLLGLRIDGNAKDLQSALFEHGFITGTSGDARVLRILPPLNTPETALDELADVLGRVGRV